MSYTFKIIQSYFIERIFPFSSYGRRTFGNFIEYEIKGPKPVAFIGNLKEMSLAVSIRNFKKFLIVFLKYLQLNVLIL